MEFKQNGLHYPILFVEYPIGNTVTFVRPVCI